MSPKSLKKFKKEVSRLLVAYRAISTAYNGPHEYGKGAIFPNMVLIEVLLQNIALDSVGTHGYSHEKDLEKMYLNIKAIEALDEYIRYSAFTHFAASQLSMLLKSFEYESCEESEEEFY